MSMYRSAFAIRGAVAGVLASCTSPACDGAEAPVPPMEVATPATPPADDGSPLGALTPDSTAWSGVVETRLDAGSYTYLEIRDAVALRWVATMGAGAPVGSPVTVRSFGTRKDFYSPRLERSFPEMVFATVEIGTRANTNG